MEQVNNLEYIFIAIGIIVFSMIISIFTYFVIRSIMIENKIIKYEDKVKKLLELPFNNKLRKLEALKDKNSRYKDNYNRIKKMYADFTEIKLETFVNRIHKLKEELKGVHFKYPHKQIESLSLQFNSLTKAGLKIINKLDALTYPDQLQLKIFINVQEYFLFFKDDYLSNRTTLKHFNNVLDKWLEEIKLKFKEYNKGNDESKELNVAKESLSKIIDDIQEFAEVVELLLIGSSSLELIIEPTIKSIKTMSLKYDKIIQKNVQEFSNNSNKYRKSMQTFINSKKMDKKIIIQRRIQEMLRNFKKFELQFKRQIKSQKLANELILPIKYHYDDITKRGLEIIDLSNKVKKNELDKLENYLNEIKTIYDEITKMFMALMRLIQKVNDNSFESATKALGGFLKYYEKSEEYQNKFSETLKFISSNLESYSRFEKYLNNLNIILVKIESNINEHNLKLDDNYQKMFSKEKTNFNKLVEQRNKNLLVYDRETENELLDNLNKMEDLLAFVERMNHISLIIETSLLLLNKQKGINIKLDEHIAKVEEEYNVGKYPESLKNLIKVIQIYDVKG